MRGSTPVRGGQAAGKTGRRPGDDRRPKGLGGEKVVGRQATKELLLAGRRSVREVLLSSELEPTPILNDIIDLADEAGVAIREAPRWKIEALAETGSHQGVLALAAPLPTHTLSEALSLSNAEEPAASATESLPGLPPPALSLSNAEEPTTSATDRPAADRPPVLVLDSVGDPGNLGALLRTAECSGVKVVVLNRHRAARISPVVAKRAAGAVEHLHFVTTGGTPSALSELAGLGVWTIGLDVAAEKTIWDFDLTGDQVALVLGAEDRGLSHLTRQRCDLVVRIPTWGSLGVLNVASAGAVALFEFARRREAL